MFQLDIDLPDIDTSLSQSTQSTPENQHGRDYWSVLNDSNFFTRGSDSNSASRLTRSSLRKTLVSLALTKPPTEYHSTPTTTTGSTKSDILVRNSRQQRHNRRSGKLSSERKKRKREVTRQEEKEDSISDYEDPVPVKKLNLDESVDAITPDILTACEGFNPVQTPHNGADSTGECRDGVGGGNGVSGDGEMCASAEVALTTSYQLSASCSGTTTEAEGVSESELESRREERGGREREKEREADEVEREGERGENGEGERESGEGGREGEGEREGVEGERETTEEDEESDSSDDDLPSFLTNTGTKIVGKCIQLYTCIHVYWHTHVNNSSQQFERREPYLVKISDVPSLACTGKHSNVIHVHVCISAHVHVHAGVYTHMMHMHCTCTCMYTCCLFCGRW